MQPIVAYFGIAAIAGSILAGPKVVGRGAETVGKTVYTVVSCPVRHPVKTFKRLFFLGD